MPQKAKKKSKKVNLQKLSDLRITANGDYIVKKPEEALFALQEAVRLTDEIDQIIIDNKIGDKKANLDKLRQALAGYQDSKGILELVDGDARSLLIERTSSQWILTDDDIPENLPEDIGEVKSLTDIFMDKWPKSPKKVKRLLASITKIVLVPTKLDEQVKAGVISADEIEPAFLNLVETSYVKVGHVK